MEIPLNNGMVTLIDDEDYERVSKYKWEARKHSHAYYADSIERVRKVSMHRFIMGLEKGDKRLVDHRDNNTLNNKKDNLRVCNAHESARARRKSKNNSSGFKGVCWSKRSSKWCAYIKVDYKKIHLGRYPDVIEAAKAYDEAATKYFGEFAITNKRLGLL